LVGPGEGTGVGLLLGLAVGLVVVGLIVGLGVGLRTKLGLLVGFGVGLLTGLADGREVVGAFVGGEDAGKGVGFLVKGLAGAGACKMKLGFVVVVVEGAWLDGSEGPRVRLAPDDIITGFSDALGAKEGTWLAVRKACVPSFATEFELATNPAASPFLFCCNITPIETLTTLTSSKMIEPTSISLTSRGDDENQLQHPLLLPFPRRKEANLAAASSST
jgi:hypothetical protein